jgi:hypothetical protein
MDMRIPFKVSAKGMQAGNHAEFLLVPEMPVEIVRIINIFLLCLAIDLLVKDTADRIAGSDEQQIKGFAVDTK